jgi:hypothetical protein
MWPIATSPPVSKPNRGNGDKREHEHFSTENESLSGNSSHGARPPDYREAVTIAEFAAHHIDLD